MAYFDKRFSVAYTGAWIGTTKLEAGVFAYQTWGSNLQPRVPSSQLGAGGFPQNFRDGFPNNVNDSDQTHHFAAYFSGGINNQYDVVNYHWKNDVKQGNLGDTALGQAAYQMGAALRNDPSSLRNIGNYIRNHICNGEPYR